MPHAPHRVIARSLLADRFLDRGVCGEICVSTSGGDILTPSAHIKQRRAKDGYTNIEEKG